MCPGLILDGEKEKLYNSATNNEGGLVVAEAEPIPRCQAVPKKAPYLFRIPIGKTQTSVAIRCEDTPDEIVWKLLTLEQGAQMSFACNLDDGAHEVLVSVHQVSDVAEPHRSVCLEIAFDHSRHIVSSSRDRVGKFLRIDLRTA